MDDAQTMFNEFCEKQGWSEGSQIDLLLTYIEAQKSPEAFKDFLQTQADEENELAEENA